MVNVRDKALSVAIHTKLKNIKMCVNKKKKQNKQNKEQENISVIRVHTIGDCELRSLLITIAGGMKGQSVPSVYVKKVYTWVPACLTPNTAITL